MQRFFEWLHARPGRPSPSVTDFDRLATIRFPLIFLLVLLHNERGADFTARLQDSPVAAWLVNVLAHGIDGVRNPTFFLISGYVFFRSVRPSVAWFKRKIAARVRTLLVPLVLWNVLALLILAAAQALHLPALPPGSAWSAPVLGHTAGELLQAIVALPSGQPLVYPLWFVRDLFVLVLVSPLIYASIRLTRGWSTAIVFLVWGAALRAPIVSSDALFFFVIGSHVAIAGKSLFALDRLGPAALIGWLLLKCQDGDDAAGLASHKALALVGVVAVLCVSGWLAQRRSWNDAINRVDKYTFFIFAAHEPLLTICRKTVFRLQDPRSPAALVLWYLAIVVGVFAILVVAFQFAERRLPRFLSLMTGSRSEHLTASIEAPVKIGRQPARLPDADRAA